jgi:flavin reductase (DIM6/NTAB) family NADH-FMN oxidoreductase RutF
MREVPVSEAIARKYPEWVLWAITADPDGQPNIMPAGWVMICNGSPLMFAVAVGFGRYTHDCLEETGEFVLAWPGVGQEKLIDQLGGCSGREGDKFAQHGLQAMPAQHVAAPLIEGCAAAFECVVVSQLELEDHSIFVGEVMAAYVADPPVDKLDNFSGEYAVAQRRP